MDSSTNEGELVAENYINISVFVLKRFKGELPFDIYVKRTESAYTKIFRSNDPVDWERVRLYVQKGIKYFYVSKVSYSAYLLLVEQMINQYLSDENSTVSSHEATEMIKEMVQLSAQGVMTTTQIERTAVETASKTVQACIKTLNRDPKGLFKILKKLSQHSYLVKHSMTVSILSIILGKALKYESNITLSNLGLGAFLHDIGRTQFSFETEEREFLSAEEWKEVRSHPEVGKRMLDHLPIPTEVKMIVLNHHEQPNGNGYPNGLRNNDIYILAKIVAICDTFASLLSDRPHRDGLRPLEALALMREDVGKFNPEMLKVFTRIFVIP